MHNHSVHHSTTDNRVPLENDNTLSVFKDIAPDCNNEQNDETIHKVAVDLNPKAEHLEITFKDHPTMSFHNKSHLDIEVRYKPVTSKQIKPELEKIFLHEKADNKCFPILVRKCDSNSVALKSKTVPQNTKREEIETQTKLVRILINGNFYIISHKYSKIHICFLELQQQWLF